MKRGVIVLSATLLVSAFMDRSTSHATPSYAPGEILVRFKPETSTESIEELHAKLGAKKRRDLPLVGVQRVQIAPGLSVEAAVSLYQQDPNVLYAEPNYIRRALIAPSEWDCNVNPTRCDQQWGLHNTGQIINITPPFSGTPDADIDAPGAWDITTGSDQTLVAVIDSGIDYVHEDLAANIWVNSGEDLNGNGIVEGSDFDNSDNDGNGFVDDLRGWNFVTESSPGCGPYTPSNPIDDNGHGTHVAGIIGAKGDNGIGVTGVMWNARLMALKILDCEGTGTVADEIAAIEYAIRMRARIINASFGGEGSEAERDAIAAAGAAGIVFVAAAGNESRNNDAIPLFPASHRLDNVIAVAASNAQDRLAVFSNFGQDTVDVAAPGFFILSTVPTCPPAPENLCDPSGYLYASGTSFATPHVSGVAGLLLAQDPSLTPAEIKAILSLTTDPLNSLSGLVASSGRLNAGKALLREAGSGLTGGGGGCGGLGFVEGGSTPPGTAIGFIAVLFLPLLLPFIRRWRLRKGILQCHQRPSCGLMLFLFVPLGVMALSAGSIQAQESTTAEPFQLPHSIALKLGYHFYPTSDYFDTNEAHFDPGDFAGVSGEFEYDYRWAKKASLSLTLGYYDGKADASEICCASFKFSTTYFLITPKYHIPALPLDGYLGAGIGYYLFERKQSGLISDTLSTSLSGFHVLIGAQWVWTPSFSTFLEVRYAWASVSSANDLDDSLGIGGTNLALGAAYHFSGFR